MNAVPVLSAERPPVGSVSRQVPGRLSPRGVTVPGGDPIAGTVLLLGLAGMVILLVGVVFVGLSPLLRSLTGDPHDVATLTTMLNPDGEANVWAWYNSMLLTLLTAVFAVHAMQLRASGSSARPQAVMAAVAGFLSLDEVAQLHEKLQRPGDLIGLTWTWGWVALGAPIAIAVGAGLLWLARRLDRAVRRRLILAGVVYLTGALVLEAIGGLLVKAWHPASTSPLYLSEVFVEESFEMAGILIALRAAWSAMTGRSRVAALGVPLRALD